jgi:hypothetical protein
MPINPYYTNAQGDLSDKDYYLTFWGYTLGTEEAEAAWKAKLEFMQRRGEGPMVVPDLPGYESPVTGKWVEGRAARREDLKRTGCRPYEGREAEQKEINRQRAYEDKKLDAVIHDTVAKAYYSFPEKQRKALREGR